MDNARSENPHYHEKNSEYRTGIQSHKQRAQRRSVGSINDWSEDEMSKQEQEKLIPQGKLTRKQKRAMPQLKHDISCGQYLHIPKESKSLFVSQATKYRRKQYIRIAFIIIFVIIATLYVTYYM